MSELEKSQVIIPEVIKEFTDKVDKVYRGLGRPVLFNFLATVANKSVFNIADRGMGKTRIGEIIPELPSPEVITKVWDSFTYDELNDFCRENYDNEADALIGRKLNFIVPELSMFSEHQRNMFLTVIAKIISDRSFSHKTSWFKWLKIEDCFLTCIVAVQPILYQNLCLQYEQWESMSYDRFVKFPVLNPLRRKTIDQDFQMSVPKMTAFKDVTFSEKNLAPIRLKMLDDLFARQISRGRSFLYARDFVKAYSAVKQKAFVSTEDLKEFYYLFYPYLTSFNMLQESTYNMKIQVSAGELKLLTKIASYGLENCPKKWLRDEMCLSDKTIENHTSKLVMRGLLVKDRTEGVWGSPVGFGLGRFLYNYFKEYDTSVQ